MIQPAKILTLAALLGSSLFAQTTGVVDKNDLTLRVTSPVSGPHGSGQTSCHDLGTILTPPGCLVYELTSIPNTPVALLISVWGCDSPGVPFTPTTPLTCGGPPSLGTNLWYALWLAPPAIPFPQASSSTGKSRWTFCIPGGTGTVHAQAVILDPCSTIWTFIFSQALTVSW